MNNFQKLLQILTPEQLINSSIVTLNCPYSSCILEGDHYMTCEECKEKWLFTELPEDHE